MQDLNRRRFLNRSTRAGVSLAAVCRLGLAGSIASADGPLEASEKDGPELLASEPAPISRQFLTRMGEQFYGMRLEESDAQAVTVLLNAVRADSQPALQMNVGPAEPALTFHPDARNR